VTRVAIFPARGGSQRIPRKNVRAFAGRPMIEWPLIAAKDSQLFDTLIVSTDDAEIATLARWDGCEVHMRPADDGSTGTNAIAGRVLKWLGAKPDDEACVIYPCSPMLWAEDLVVGHEAFERARDRYTFSALAGPSGTWTDAGCYYWAVAKRFMRNAPMTPHDQRVAVDRRSFIDINTEEDIAKAEAMFAKLSTTA